MFVGFFGCCFFVCLFLKWYIVASDTTLKKNKNRIQICKLISATFMHWLRTSGTSQVIYLMNPECQVYERIKCIHLEKKEKLNTEKKGMCLSLYY